MLATTDVAREIAPQAAVSPMENPLASTTHQFEIGSANYPKPESEAVLNFRAVLDSANIHAFKEAFDHLYAAPDTDIAHELSIFFGQQHDLGKLDVRQFVVDAATYAINNAPHAALELMSPTAIAQAHELVTWPLAGIINPAEQKDASRKMDGLVSLNPDFRSGLDATLRTGISQALATDRELLQLQSSGLATSDQRLQFCQRVVDIASYVAGLSRQAVHRLENGGNQGEASNATNNIGIAVDIPIFASQQDQAMRAENLLDTTLHEWRHSFQNGLTNQFLQSHGIGTMGETALQGTEAQPAALQQGKLFLLSRIAGNADSSGVVTYTNSSLERDAREFARAMLIKVVSVWNPENAAKINPDTASIFSNQDIWTRE